MSKRIVFRVDADSGMGAGHVMRCLALAQAWRKRGGASVFMGRIDSPSMVDRLRAEGVGYRPLRGVPDEDLRDVAQECGTGEGPGAWAVLDGYQFDFECQKALSACCAGLLVVDDYAHLPRYHADIILNQNVNAADMRYEADGTPKMLLGLGYCLLRDEFLRHERSKRGGFAAESPRNVLVTMGGADPDNATLKVLEGVFDGLDSLGEDFADCSVRAVVGPLNPHWAELELFAERHEGCELLRSVTDMPGLLDWADVAVSAGGSTCWELAYFQVPFLVAVLAENQAGIARGLHEAGAAISLGRAEALGRAEVAEAFCGMMAASAVRRRMAEVQRGLVVGRGADRVCDVLEASMKRGVQ